MSLTKLTFLGYKIAPSYSKLSCIIELLLNSHQSHKKSTNQYYMVRLEQQNRLFSDAAAVSLIFFLREKKRKLV